MKNLPNLLSKVKKLGNSTSNLPTANIIAFSGGVDSSVVAALVHRVYPFTSTAVLGISNAVHKEQIDLARQVAKTIGIPLQEIVTKEGDIPEYVSNAGNACFYCKTELYENLQKVGKQAASQFIKDHCISNNGGKEESVVLFNGTNGDDAKDPTRVGLIAADNFDVASPLSELTKKEVRELALELQLPNHSHAASPCLRSRLALGVEATKDHLIAVENAERLVRNKLSLKVENNLRVRLLPNGKSAIEIDHILINDANKHFNEFRKELKRFGFNQLEVREFKSGSVNGLDRTIE